MKLTQEQIQEMQRLRSEGASIKELTEKFEVNKNTVQYHTLKHAKFSPKHTPDFYKKIRRGER